MAAVRILQGLAALLIFTAFLHAQPPPAVALPRLDAVTTVDAPWSFHPGGGDSAGTLFADPAFDDSAWPRLRPDQLLASANLPLSATGDAWARLHLRVSTSQGPLGMALDAHSGQQYLVYANGRLVGASPGVLAGFQQRSTPFAIALPQAGDLVLAVHILSRKTRVEPRFPISRLRIGPLAAVADAVELERLRIFDGEWLTGIFAGLVYLSFVPIALILFVARRDRREYLWLAVFCLVGAVYMFFSVADGVGAMPETLLNKILYIYSGWGTLIAGLEFVGIFVATSRRAPLRVFQALLCAGPLIFFVHWYAVYDATLGITLLIWMAMVTTYLVSAYRRGQAESGLLLVPFACIPVVTLFSVLASFFPRFFRLTTRTRLGHIGVGLDDFASILFIFGILAIVLFRFVRVSRDEQRAAAELEAARTVQQVLIPASGAADHVAIPGYIIASVYQPAREVGGDFFQVLPLPGGQGGLIVLGDVSGKGLRAAMTVAVIVGALQTQAEYTHSPAVLLAGLNRRLHGRGAGFTTCVILSIEPNGLVCAANAGHLQPYLQGVELTLDSGLPLGLLPEATYTDSPFTLPPGATLTLLTDGVVEAANPATRELFGFERTLNLSTQPAAYIADAARAFGPPEAQDDDITVLTITRAREPNPRSQTP